MTVILLCSSFAETSHLPLTSHFNTETLLVSKTRALCSLWDVTQIASRMWLTKMETSVRERHCFFYSFCICCKSSVFNCFICPKVKHSWSTKGWGFVFKVHHVVPHCVLVHVQSKSCFSQNCERNAVRHDFRRGSLIHFLLIIFFSIIYLNACFFVFFSYCYVVH